MVILSTLTGLLGLLERVGLFTVSGKCSATKNSFIVFAHVGICYLSAPPLFIHTAPPIYRFFHESGCYYLPRLLSPPHLLLLVAEAPSFSFIHPHPAPVPSTRPVACSLHEEASWLWFVFFPRCRPAQSERLLTATALLTPPIPAPALLSLPPRRGWPSFKTWTGGGPSVVFVAMGQRGLPRQGRSHKAETEKQTQREGELNRVWRRYLSGFVLVSVLLALNNWPLFFSRTA